MQKNILRCAIFSSLILLASSGATYASADYNSHFSAGEKAFAASNFAGAAESFAQALKYVPEDLKSRFRYGQALYSLDKFSESYNQFQAVLQNSPGNIIARVYLAENLVRLGRAPEARTHVEWILKIQPGHSRAQQLLDALNAKTSLPLAAPEKVAANNNPAPRSVKTAKNYDFASFLKAGSDSFLINLEQARFYIEQGDLSSVSGYLEKAEKLARNSRDHRRFLEIQILNSLVFVYKRDFKGFGQHLMKLKPVLSPESYQSFLDIYNQGIELKDSCEQARLAAGVAMGAGHYAIALPLLSEAFNKYPSDPLIASLLADAQMQSLDYKGAEVTLSHIARNDKQNGEAYFNLARFYLTVFYKPEQVRSYANYAASLRPDDARNSILLALLDYSEGRITEGVERIKGLITQIKDPALNGVCEKIISDGETANTLADTKKQVNFAAVLALPGAPHAPLGNYALLGEDFLRRGSFFTAMKYFTMAQDLSEIGRTYLGVSSALKNAGEIDLATIAADYGLNVLNQEIARKPANARAHLYLALYHFDSGDKVAARKSVEYGLAAGGERHTRASLTAILKALKS